eukprot:m.23421 g.23421  ORF g.23421 m.23421 type:complete len:442 (+) comp28469_c0_seq1:89-1414(+)
MSATILPDELLLLVFDALPVTDLLSAGLTCRHWFRLSRDELIWKKRLCSEYPSQGLLEKDAPAFPEESSYSNYVKLWSCVPRTCVQTCSAHKDEVLYVCFSHSGRLACTASKDATAAVWTVTESHRLSLLDSIDVSQPGGFEHALHSSFNPTDTLLLVCASRPEGIKGMIHVYDISKKHVIAHFRNSPFDTFATWMNENEILFGTLQHGYQGGYESVLNQCDVYTKRQDVFGIYQSDCHLVTSMLQFIQQDTEAAVVMFTKVGQYELPQQVAFSKRLKVGDGSSVRSFNLNDYIIGLKMSPDHQYLYCNCRPFKEDQSEELAIEESIVTHAFRWHGPNEEMKQVQSLTGHRSFTEMMNCFFIYLDVHDDYIASGAEDRMVHIWHRQSGAKVATLSGHEDVVNAVAFNPINPHMLLSASDDHTLKVWLSKSHSTKFDKEAII